MDSVDHLFARNREWASRIRAEEPDFFTSLSRQQAPQYLWIGCSDSRVPANQIVDLPPGEVFVHRNIANVVVHSDLNCLSVIQYAVDVLHIQHIIVCGHYGCGGIDAALERSDHGLIDDWLEHIRSIQRHNSDELKGLELEDKANRLCELNVIEQVKNVARTSIVQRAWRTNTNLSVHGFIYDINNGILKDLHTCLSSNKLFEENG